MSKLVDKILFVTKGKNYEWGNRDYVASRPNSEDIYLDGSTAMDLKLKANSFGLEFKKRLVIGPQAGRAFEGQSLEIVSEEVIREALEMLLVEEKISESQD